MPTRLPAATGGHTGGMTADPTFADLGEDALVARILGRIPAAPAVIVGPGDDAAVTESPGRLVSSADMLVEGEDFLPSWLDPHRLGIKAAAQNLADVRAMGATPTGLLLSLAAPGTTPASFVDGLVDGLVEEAGRAGAVLLGGDLSDAGQIVIAVTALGALPVDQPPLTRTAARPGHDVWLGGRTGWAAAGLDLLFADSAEAARARDAEGPAADSPVSFAIEMQRAPRPAYAAVDALQNALAAHADAVHSGAAHADPAAGTQAPAALIDLSDGLRSDAGRLARASGAVIDLDGAALDSLAEDLLPVAQHVLALEGDAAAADSPDAVRTRARSWVLHGGEDHGFLATVPEGVNPLGWRRVGRVRPAVDAPSAPVPDAGSIAGRSVLIDGVPAEESGFAAVDPDGGYRHFSSTGE